MARKRAHIWRASMKKTLFGLATALAVAGGSLIFIGASKLEVPAPAAPAAAVAGTNWEYIFLDGQFTKKVKILSSKYEDDMAAANELGKQGWELVTSLPKTGPGGKPTEYFYYIFKRPAD